MSKNNILIILSSIFLFFIVILGSFSLMINYKSFYYDEYGKYDAYSKISGDDDYSKEYVTNVTENMFKFFKGKEDLRYFNDEEKSHMNDVKIVFSAMNFIYYSSALFFIIIFFILYFLAKKDKLLFIEGLSKILVYGSTATLIFLVTIFLWSVFSFESLFSLMHLVLFPQGNWTFPADSLLIKLFPQGFFFDMALRIFVYAIFQAGIFFMIGYWLRKQVRMSRQHKK